MTPRDDKTDTDTDSHEPATEPDVASDPALDDEEGGEWADEGGAVEEGPATDTDAG